MRVGSNRRIAGYVIKGSWRYLVYDWIARAGEVHTLVVDQGVEEMITLFHVQGTLILIDFDDEGRPFVERFIR